MVKVLRIDASPRSERSLSRQLASQFLEEFESSTKVDLAHRDLSRTDLPFVDEEWISAAFTAEDQRSESQKASLALSDMLIEELSSAELLVISTPLYNYGMPAVLKAWVDQVVRVGKTFSFDLARGDFPIEPMLTGKTLALLTSSGEFGFEPAGIRQDKDHLVPHFGTVATYLGVVQTEHIGIEYQEFGDARHVASKTRAHNAAKNLARRLASSLPSNIKVFT